MIKQNAADIDTTLAASSEAFSDTSSVEYVVDIVNLSKSFQRRSLSSGAPSSGRGGYTTLKSSLLKLLRGGDSQRAKPILTQAIKDLTLRIPKGSSIGLIGRNGSGKSTFLKLVTGIYKPTSGKITVAGRVAALIELGAGFHPDFTGRENLILAGVMHGLTREEVLSRFDEIVSFAELWDVIDDPVRTFSSGMFMRLGFSVAVHTDPDILLVDEVLAVGDAGFVAKCRDRIAQLRSDGKTLILVTHDLEAVERWCDEAIWLHNGEVRDRGYPRRVIDAYRGFIEKGEEGAILRLEAKLEEAQTESRSDILEAARWGSREVEITGVRLYPGNSQVDERRVYHPHESMRVRIEYTVHAPQDEVVFGIGIHRADGLNVFGTNTEIDRVALKVNDTSGAIECVIERLTLLDGSYVIDVAVHRVDGYPYDYQKSVVHFSVRSDNRVVGVISPERRWFHNEKEVGRCE
jgi:lipopolysaccharide transport system ATP-binding protein